MKKTLVAAILALSATPALAHHPLAGAPMETDEFFGLSFATKCSSVPDEVLTPKSSWSSAAKYDETAKKLASLFTENFKTYESHARPAVKAAGPK